MSEIHPLTIHPPFRRFISHGIELIRTGPTILSLLACLVNCADLDRSNPLDPKNPASHRDKTVLIEAFVNQSGGDVISWALAGLDQLTREYNSPKVLYLEHHVAKTVSTDPLALDASLSRYLALVPQTAQQGLPDVFFNGSTERVQGASSAARAYQRYLDALKNQLSGSSFFTIEAVVQDSGDHMTFYVQFAPLGQKSASKASIYLVLAEEKTSAHPVVRSIVLAETFDEIPAGKIINMTKSLTVKSDWQKSNLKAFVVIQNNRTCEVLTSAEVDID